MRGFAELSTTESSTMRALALFTLLFAFAESASAFEGVLHQQTTIAQVPPIASDVSLRENGDTRTDSVVPGTGEPLTVIQKSDGKTVTTFTLMHAKKVYTQTTAAADAPTAGNMPEMLKGMEVKVLADEAVAGHACKHVQLTQNASTAIEIWMADDMGLDVGKLRGTQAVAAGMLKVLEQKGVKGFPLKMKATHLGQTLTLETVRVEVKKLDATTFEVPKGYSKLELPPEQSAPQKRTP
jgi:hypothetical protein